MKIATPCVPPSDVASTELAPGSIAEDTSVSSVATTVTSARGAPMQAVVNTARPSVADVIFGWTPKSLPLLLGTARESCSKRTMSRYLREPTTDVPRREFAKKARPTWRCTVATVTNFTLAGSICARIELTLRDFNVKNV